MEEDALWARRALRASAALTRPQGGEGAEGAALVRVHRTVRPSLPAPRCSRLAQPGEPAAAEAEQEALLRELERYLTESLREEGAAARGAA